MVFCPINFFQHFFWHIYMHFFFKSVCMGLCMCVAVNVCVYVRACVYICYFDHQFDTQFTQNNQKIIKSHKFNWPNNFLFTTSSGLVSLSIYKQTIHIIYNFDSDPKIRLISHYISYYSHLFLWFFITKNKID